MRRESKVIVGKNRLFSFANERTFVSRYPWAACCEREHVATEKIHGIGEFVAARERRSEVRGQGGHRREHGDSAESRVRAKRARCSSREKLGFAAESNDTSRFELHAYTSARRAPEAKSSTNRWRTSCSGKLRQETERSWFFHNVLYSRAVRINRRYRHLRSRTFENSFVWKMRKKHTQTNRCDADCPRGSRPHSPVFRPLRRSSSFLRFFFFFFLVRCCNDYSAITYRFVSLLQCSCDAGDNIGDEVLFIFFGGDMSRTSNKQPTIIFFCFDIVKKKNSLRVYAGLGAPWCQHMQRNLH